MPSTSPPFLKRVAERYLELVSENNGEVCLVFPNRRAALFFRQELVSLNPVNQWMPDIFSADEFIRHCMQVQPIDSVTALFEFYSVYRSTEGEKADPFDVYLTWAPQLLHDFEEVDQYLVDAVKLYKCVDDNYAMEKWSPDRQPISEIQKAYLHFWSMMGTWYTAFRKHLTERNLCTSAMVYRSFAENIKEKGLSLEWNKILVCGFSALNGAEQQIFKFLDKTGRAELLWDIDAYYINDELHEAGHFFRKYRNEWAAHTFKDLPARIDRAEQTFEFIGVAKNLGQVIEAGTLLNEMAEKGHGFEDTAVVLSDERLLMPMLEVIPESVPAVNVTMAYPLHQLPVMGLFHIIFDLQRRASKANRQGIRAFYFKDLLRLLRQPDIRRILGDAACKDLIRRINKSSHKYVNILAWEEGSQLHEKIGFVFESWESSVEEAMKCLLKLSRKLIIDTPQDEGESNYISEALEQVTSILNRISDYNRQYTGILTLESLQRVFNQLARHLSLSFYGEPLNGLQLMGLLETRNVEFKNLIILSVNEGILPASRTHRTFIPFDIALGFGLPTYRDRDALFAYHFYRMIQGAERVQLIYNTEHDEFGKGEQSRFITQLSQELKHAKRKHSIRIPDLPAHIHGAIRIEKSPEILNRIIERYNPDKENPSGLSATALKEFIKCSLRFYLTYFSDVHSEEDRTDGVESNQSGTICHETLKVLYTPYIGKVLKPNDFEKMKSNLESVLTQQFCKELKVDTIETGKHILVFETQKNMLLRYLNWERDAIKQDESDGIYTTIAAVETKLDKTISIPHENGAIRLYLKGFADRIDIRDQVTRILDYKTGSAEPKEMAYDAIEEIFTLPEREKAMQMFFYHLLYADRNTQSQLDAGIVPLKHPSKGLLKAKNLETNHNEQIEKGFTGLISRIFDKNEAFEQTEETERCKFCSFKGVCGRN